MANENPGEAVYRELAERSTEKALATFQAEEISSEEERAERQREFAELLGNLNRESRRRRRRGGHW